MAPHLTALQVSARCGLLLRRFRDQYVAHHPIRTGDPPVPIRGHDVIHRALDYGIATCSAVQHFIEARQPWFAAAITRTYFELILRIMWGRTRSNGWQELIGWWAEETLAAADRQVADLGSDPLGATARQVLTGQAQVSPKQKPNLVKMLNEVSEKQNSTEHRQHIKQTYALLFKGALHQAAHANITFLGFTWPGGDELAIGRSVVRASSWLICTCDDYLGWQPEKTVAYMNSFLSLSEPVS